MEKCMNCGKENAVSISIGNTRYTTCKDISCIKYMQYLLKDMILNEFAWKEEQQKEV